MMPDADRLTAEDRRSLMFASHLCQLIADSIDPDHSHGMDVDAVALLRKFAETAHREIEQVLTGKAG